MKKLLKNIIKVIRNIAIIDYTEEELMAMSSPCWEKTVFTLPTESEKNVF